MIKKIIIISICFGLLIPFLSDAVSAPTVQFKANNISTSPVSIPYNSSVTLTWSSTNADYCQASGDWSGISSTSGTLTFYNITSNKYFKITCYNASGFYSAEIDTVVSNVVNYFKVNKFVSNVSQKTAYQETISALPGESLSFHIVITTDSSGLKDVNIKETLPSGIVYLGNIIIDGVSNSGNITTGINIGDFSSNQSKLISFDAVVGNANQFSVGTTTLTNTILVYNTLFSASDTAKVLVYKASGPTTVPTGLTDNFFFDSFFLPLVITFLIIWLFKSHIINFEKWADLKRNEYRSYKARKSLNEIRSKELLKEKKN